MKKKNFDILNSNEYKRGFEEGKAAAEKGKDKNYLGMISLKSFIWGNASMDTYTQGYNEGYAFALKQKSLVSEITDAVTTTTRNSNNRNNNFNNNLNTTNMAEMNLEVQKQKMLEMRSFLGDFSTLLNSRMQGLSDKLNEYVVQGFPSDIAAHYGQMYYATEKQEIDALIQTIQTAHYEYIDNVVADIQAAIDRQ
ncbi:MAG: hypothetical protein LBE04_03980 [Prevotellaceae bacterium]|jgi:hypothetical protein|nr:hypothetical protein [Prevotellaceae bacterium]